MKKNDALIYNINIILRILPFFWSKGNYQMRLNIIISITLSIFMIVLDLTVPVIFKKIIVLLSQNFDNYQIIVISFITLYGVLWAFVRLCDKLKEVVLFKPVCLAITDFSLTVFKHIHSLDLQFHLNRETGKIAGAIEKSQFAIAMVFTNLLFRIVPIIIGIICAFATLWYLYDFVYGFLLLLALLVDLLFTFYTTEKLIRHQNFLDELTLKEDARLIDSLLNIDTVKYFNAQQYEVTNAKKLYKKTAKGALRLLITQSRIEIVHACIIGVSLIFTSYTVGCEVLNNNLSAEDFILINGYFLVFLSQLYLVGFLFRYVIMRFAQIKPVEQLLTTNSNLIESEYASTLKINKGNIKFENVSFGYKTRKNVLNNLNFEIPGGSTVAIVGPTGSGKSTISKLLFRLYDATSGSIYIDGQSITNVKISSLRKSIAIVPQEVTLFNETLRYNICYGNFDASDEDILQVVKKVSLDNFIRELPEGLMTQVGERGLKLSGGERQRIAIARALLKQPAILVFDEATSSLDNNTEKEIQKSIKLAAKNKTTIIIAHRLSTIEQADTILVLRGGSVVEMGTHEELLAYKGTYFSLWNLQLSKNMGL